MDLTQIYYKQSESQLHKLTTYVKILLVKTLSRGYKLKYKIIQILCRRLYGNTGNKTHFHQLGVVVSITIDK